jgi:secondary thiamine-phosphate synthase enzyme
VQLLARAAVSSPADAPPGGAVDWVQNQITLPAKRRGCHVVTREIVSQVPEISEFEVGLANIFILHTSAGLTINENASPDVPLDLNDALEKLAPEGSHYRHLDEGYDDMPAHVKSSLMGPSLTIPISRGRLALGTWQGIYLVEARNHGGGRSMVVTLQGRRRADGQKYGQYR